MKNVLRWVGILHNNLPFIYLMETTFCWEQNFKLKVEVFECKVLMFESSQMENTLCVDVSPISLELSLSFMSNEVVLFYLLTCKLPIIFCWFSTFLLFFEWCFQKVWREEIRFYPVFANQRFTLWKKMREQKQK